MPDGEWPPATRSGQVLLTFSRFPANPEVPGRSTDLRLRALLACQVCRSVSAAQPFGLRPPELAGGGQCREGSRGPAEAPRPDHTPSSDLTATASSREGGLTRVGALLASRLASGPVHEGQSGTCWQQHQFRFHGGSGTGTASSIAATAAGVPALAGGSLRAGRQGRRCIAHDEGVGGGAI
jgi:hypothetical protein